MRSLKQFPLFARLMIGATLGLNMGRYVVLPFFSVYLIETLHLSPLQAGILLSLFITLSDLFPIITGTVTARIGLPLTLLCSCLLCLISLICFSFFSSFPLLLLVSLFYGLGSASLEPALRASLGSLREQERKTAFTYFHQAINLGALLGAIIGGLSWSIDQRTTFLVSAILFGLLFLGFWYFYQEIPRVKQNKVTWQTYREILRNKPFLFYTVSMIFYWMLYVQLYVTFPVQLFRTTQSDFWMQAVIPVNCLLSYLLMFWLRKTFIQYHSFQMITIGMLIMATSIFALPVTGFIWWAFLCLLCFTFGETISMPSTDLAVIEQTKPQDYSSYFGVFYGLSYGIGGSLGNFIGAYATDSSTSVGWSLFGILSLVGILFLYLLQCKFYFQEKITPSIRRNLSSQEKG
ncbi:MFS transporter [Risungbinella massiliensis]|uniref:MFS transporter n=1 Tax=Risungbinella massiliensis TaxID=1329796 RepID=UPI0005CB988E|nr:MFS transporter [Risungbinella massiliensis]